MTATIHNDGAGRAAILLLAGLTNAGWETRTAPGSTTITIINGDATHHIHPAPIGHGTWWWRWGPSGSQGRAIALLGDTDHALQRINNTLGPPPANR